MRQQEMIKQKRFEYKLHVPVHCVHAHVNCSCSSSSWSFGCTTSNTLQRHALLHTSTVEPPNKGHLGTRASVLYSEVSFIRRLEMY